MPVHQIEFRPHHRLALAQTNFERILAEALPDLAQYHLDIAESMIRDWPGL